MIKVYEYKNCSTCKNALKFLDSEKIQYQKLAIRDTPPSVSELKMVLKSLSGDIKRLFNISGQDYKTLNMKDKIPKMTTEEMLQLLSENGNLVKRPFIVAKDKGITGFKIDEWNEFFRK